MSHDKIETFDYDGKTINRRQLDGFINLTQMCQANGKRLDVFMKAQKTKRYIECLERSHQMVVTDVVQGGEPSLQGTWGHPTLAINLARWINPEFAVWCDQHIFNLMIHGTTTLNPEIQTELAQIKKDYQEIKEENRIIMGLLDQMPAFMQKISDLIEDPTNSIVDAATEKLERYHTEKSKEFKRLREINEIQRWNLN